MRAIVACGLLLSACSAAQSSGGSGAAQAAADVSWQGKWAPVDHDAAGSAVFVDRSSIVPFEESLRRADLGLASKTGREIRRVVFDCKRRSIQSQPSSIGSAGSVTVNMLGDTAREPAHLAVIDFVCDGKRSKPEDGQPDADTLRVAA